MKNFALFLIAAVSILTISSCAKKGCTDVSALNFDVKATSDDGSCAFLVDNFVGIWAAKDTTVTRPFGSSTITSTKTDTRSFKISRKTSSEIYLIDFGGCTDTVTASITATSFFATGVQKCGFNNFTAALNGNVLTYTFTPNSSSSQQVTVSGKATK